MLRVRIRIRIRVRVRDAVRVRMLGFRLLRCGRVSVGMSECEGLGWCFVLCLLLFDFFDEVFGSLCGLLGLDLIEVVCFGCFLALDPSDSDNVDSSSLISIKLL